MIFYPGQKRLRIYGVSAPGWTQMVGRHGGLCWICKEGAAVALDHCHKTGAPRGALCGPCNTTLHSLEKSGWLASAEAYLASYD